MAATTSLTVPVRTTSHDQMVDITSDVSRHIPKGFTGLCHLFCLHTTAALTINENADPDVVSDMLRELERLVPWKNPAHNHLEGNTSAHVKSSVFGPGLTIPVRDGALVLGTWQGVYFCEFDGPRHRRVNLTLIPA